MFNNNRFGCCSRVETTSGCQAPRRPTCPTTNTEPVTYSTQPETSIATLDFELCSSTCCAVPCQFVTFTLRIRNNCSTTICNPILDFDLGESLCFVCGSLTVNGRPRCDVKCPHNIELDPIEANEEVCITLEARIMTPDRCIVSHAELNYQLNCCCTTRCLRTISNGNIIQVCQCCCGDSSPEVR